MVTSNNTAILSLHPSTSLSDHSRLEGAAADSVCRVSLAHWLTMTVVVVAVFWNDAETEYSEVVIVKLRESEGKRVDLGRSLKGLL